MGCCEARTLWPCFAADPTACDAVACDAGPAARARPAAAQSARRRGSDGTAARCACDRSRRGASSPACCSLTALRCDCRPCGRRSGHMVSANIACSLGDGALRSRLIETNSAQTCAHVWGVKRTGQRADASREGDSSCSVVFCEAARSLANGRNTAAPSLAVSETQGPPCSCGT